jgi:hypothetical protein
MLKITNYTKFILNSVMIVRIIAGKLLWIKYVKVSNLFSNYVEPEQFRPGLEIVCKWEIYVFNVYACAKLQGVNESVPVNIIV